MKKFLTIFLIIFLVSAISLTLVFLGNKKVTVEFETNGGTIIESIEVKNVKGFKLPESPSKEGFVFSGWYLDEQLTKEYTSLEELKGTIKLYAKWEENKSDDNLNNEGNENNNNGDNNNNDENNSNPEDDNVILNILKQFSLDDYKDISLTLKNVKLNHKSIENWIEINDIAEIDLEMCLWLDENNNLIGTGKINTAFIEENKEQNEGADVYLYNENLYSRFSFYEFGPNEEMGKINLEELIIDYFEFDENIYDDGKELLNEAFKELFGELGITTFETIEEFLQAINNWYDDSFSKIINNLEIVNKGNPLEMVSEILTKMVDITKTSAGYELRIKKVEIADKTMYSLLEELFGEKNISNIDIILEFSVDKLIKFVEKKGLNLEELIKSLDALVQILYDDPSLSCDDLFGTDLLEAINDEKIRKTSVIDILVKTTGYSKEDIKEQIESWLEEAKMMTIGEFIEKYVPIDVSGVLENDVLDYVIYVNKDYTIKTIQYKVNTPELAFEEYDFQMNGELYIDFNKEEKVDTLELKTTIDDIINGFKETVTAEAIIKLTNEHLFPDRFENKTWREENGKYYLDQDFKSWEYIYDEELNREVELFKVGTRTIEFDQEMLMNANYFNISRHCNGYYYVHVEPFVKIYENYEVICNEEDPIYQEYLYQKYYQQVQEQRLGLQVHDFGIYFNPETRKYGRDDIISEVICDYQLDKEKSIINDNCLEYDTLHYSCTKCGYSYVYYGDKNPHHKYIVEDGEQIIVKCYDCEEYVVEWDNHKTEDLYLETVYISSDYGIDGVAKIIFQECVCGCHSKVSIDCHEHYNSPSRIKIQEGITERVYEHEKPDGTVINVFKYVEEIIYLEAEKRYQTKYYFGYEGSDYTNAKLVLTVLGKQR